MVIIRDEILFWIVIAIGSLALGVLLFTIIFKVIVSRWDNYIEKLTSKIENTLVDFLVNENDQSQKALTNIKKFSTFQRSQSILIDLLLKLNHNFSGVYDDKIYDLYETLELHKVALAKLRSRKWDEKVRGIYELSTLEYEEAFDEITKYINHKRPSVKRSARVAIVKIKKKEGLFILNNLEGKMSYWTYINVVATLKRHPVKLTDEEIDIIKSSKNKYMHILVKELENSVYVQ